MEFPLFSFLPAFSTTLMSFNNFAFVFFPLLIFFFIVWVQTIFSLHYLPHFNFSKQEILIFDEVFLIPSDLPWLSPFFYDWSFRTSNIKSKEKYEINTCVRAFAFSLFNYGCWIGFFFQFDKNAVTILTNTYTWSWCVSLIYWRNLASMKHKINNETHHFVCFLLKWKGAHLEKLDSTSTSVFQITHFIRKQFSTFCYEKKIPLGVKLLRLFECL